MRTLGTTDLDLLEALFDQHSGSPFFIKDSELRYLAANRAMAGLCGVGTARQLIGRRASDVFSRALADHYETLDRSVIETGRPMTNVLEPTLGPDGGTAWLLFTRLPVRDVDGKIVGVAANARRLPAGESTEACYRRLQLATDRLRETFEGPTNLLSVAAAIGISMTQLERDFRKVFGMTPRAFLHVLRLEQARALLEDASLSIAQIAHACGYADHSAFSRRFLREFGTTPTAYRKGRAGSTALG